MSIKIDPMKLESMEGNDLSHIFTSGYSDHLLFYEVNQETQHVFLDGPCTVEPSFSFGFVSETHKSIYFVHEVNEYNGTSNSGAASRWKINTPTSRIYADKNNKIHHNTKMGESPIEEKEVVLTRGGGPAHVNVDEENGILHVANYGGGSYIAYSIDTNNGAIMEQIFFESYGKGSNVVPDRQADAHAHMVFFVKEFIYVVDLGSDKIWHYKVIKEGSNRIEKADPPFTAMPPGYGPRHMTATTRFEEGQQRVYVINELESYIIIFKLDEQSGMLEMQGMVETMPPNTPGQAGAEISLHPSEKWLYVSNRGNGAILTYTVLADGSLEKIQNIPTSGTMPRHFRINREGSLMYVVNQDTNTLDLLEIDQDTGMLMTKEKAHCEISPTFIGLLD